MKIFIFETRRSEATQKMTTILGFATTTFLIPMSIYMFIMRNLKIDDNSSFRDDNRLSDISDPLRGYLPTFAKTCERLLIFANVCEYLRIFGNVCECLRTLLILRPRVVSWTPGPHFSNQNSSATHSGKYQRTTPISPCAV